jgi:hypothetical protein
MRVEITTSGTAALRTQGGDRDLAITPDGSRIIYRGQSQLLVRALDRLTPTALTGLGAPRGVFASPDGQWVGFFDGPALKKVTITGGNCHGNRRCLWCSAGATRGEDGRSFRRALPTAGLYRASADGVIDRVTTPDRDRGEGDQLAGVLPGADAVPFTIVPGRRAPDDAQIAAGSPHEHKERARARRHPRPLCPIRAFADGVAGTPVRWRSIWRDSRL